MLQVHEHIHAYIYTYVHIDIRIHTTYVRSYFGSELGSMHIYRCRYSELEKAASAAPPHLLGLLAMIK